MAQIDWRFVLAGTSEVGVENVRGVQRLIQGKHVTDYQMDTVYIGLVFHKKRQPRVEELPLVVGRLSDYSLGGHRNISGHITHTT
jgi:hypothetical protein